jgi:hypothetical protein
MCCLALAFIAFAGLTVGFNGSKAEASTITFELDKVFTGYPPPEARVSWWLRATFDDGGTPGTVTLTMITGCLVEEEFVGEWFFNFDGNLADLHIDYYSDVAASSVVWGYDPKEDEFIADSYKADGDGYFDILFDFPQNEIDRFWAGKESVYIITGEGINASSFSYWSSPGGGQGIFFSAAHVQGIDGPTGENRDHSWVGAVPIPTSVLLLGSGLLGLIAIRRRTSRKD